MSPAHIVVIRTAGAVAGYQLRIPGGQPFRSRYFPAKALGGVDVALRAARGAARQAGLAVTPGRGGSTTGRRQLKSPTPAAGIRWQWRPYFGEAALAVVASWTANNGTAKQTSYSTQRHGLAGALQLAIAARTSTGAPWPDADALLKALRRAHRAGPK